eukprot:350397-Chlamydomonas_euryale.AAC.5
MPLARPGKQTSDACHWHVYFGPRLFPPAAACLARAPVCLTLPWCVILLPRHACRSPCVSHSASVRDPPAAACLAGAPVCLTLPWCVILLPQHALPEPLCVSLCLGV